VIVLEHRLFGLSNPYPDLYEESFVVHNLENATGDPIYFANHVGLVGRERMARQGNEPGTRSLILGKPGHPR